MPALSFAGGKLMLIYYDLQEDRSQVFTKNIDDKTAILQSNPVRRHTFDVRVAMASPGAAPAFADSQSVWTEPDDEWVQRVFAICQPILKEKPVARTAPYMTDAANLRKVYAGAPTVILGPGEAAMAHQTDEYCDMERIRQSVAIYEEIIGDWSRN